MATHSANLVLSLEEANPYVFTMKNALRYGYILHSGELLRSFYIVKDVIEILEGGEKAVIHKFDTYKKFTTLFPELALSDLIRNSNSEQFAKLLNRIFSVGINASTIADQLDILRMTKHEMKSKIIKLEQIQASDIKRLECSLSKLIKTINDFKSLQSKPKYKEINLYEFLIDLRSSEPLYSKYVKLDKKLK